MRLKTLIVLTSHSQLGTTGQSTGFWLSELTHPYFALTEAGIDVDIACIKSGETVVDPKSVDLQDPDNEKFLRTEHLAKTMKNCRALIDVNFNDYQAICFAGGHGTMWDFPNNPAIKQAIETVYANNGIVAAICHGPAAFVGVDLIKGKEVTAFSNEEEDEVGLTQQVPFLLQDQLSEQGANFQSKSAWSEHCIVDQQIVTGQNPQSAKLVGRKIVELLKNDS